MKRSLLRIVKPAHPFTSTERQKKRKKEKIWTHKYTFSSITKSKNICSSHTEDRLAVSLHSWNWQKMLREFFFDCFNLHVNDNVLLEQQQWDQPSSGNSDWLNSSSPTAIALHLGNTAKPKQTKNVLNVDFLHVWADSLSTTEHLRRGTDFCMTSFS